MKFSEIQDTIQAYFAKNPTLHNSDEFNWTVVHRLKQARFKIISSKKLNYDHTKLNYSPWIWYKSMNIPAINITNELFHQEGGADSFQAQIFSIWSSESQEQVQIYNSSLKGQTVVKLEAEKCQFKKIKFLDTSYKKGKSLFYLIVVVYKEEQDQRSIFQISISPSIFLESRRKTYPEKVLAQKNTMVNISLFEPFLPKVLMEGYEKGTLFKQQDSASQDSHTEQDNVNLAIEENNLEQGSLELLLSYLSCPNIRIKVFHPLFLSIKFNKVLKLYYNQEQVTVDPEENPQQFIYQIFLKIFQSFTVTEKKINWQNRLLLLCLVPDSTQTQDNLQKSIDKVSRYLTCLEGKAVKYFPFNIKESELPKHFKQFFYKELDIMEAYKAVYSTLSNVQFQMKLENRAEKPKPNVVHLEKAHCYTTKIRILNREEGKANLIQIPIEKKKQTAYQEIDSSKKKIKLQIPDNQHQNNSNDSVSTQTNTQPFPSTDFCFQQMQMPNMLFPDPISLSLNMPFLSANQGLFYSPNFQQPYQPGMPIIGLPVVYGVPINQQALLGLHAMNQQLLKQTAASFSGADDKKSPETVLPQQ